MTSFITMATPKTKKVINYLVMHNIRFLWRYSNYIFVHYCKFWLVFKANFSQIWSHVCTLYNQYILLNSCCIAGSEEDLKLLHGDKVVHLSGTKDTIQRVTVHVPYTLRCGIRSNDYLVRITPLYRRCPRSIQKRY